MLGVVLPSRVIAAGLTAATLDGAAGEAAEREFSKAFVREVSAAVEPGSSCSSRSSRTGGPPRWSAACGAITA